MPPPSATYRLQFQGQFGFREAAEIVPFLAGLGISHIYASPIFQAREGSSHGYDIVDPGRLSSALGGEGEFAALVAEVKRAGLAWLQDIVPNHMAVDSRNRMLMDVLEKGETSRFARFFDIDWTHPDEGLRGRLLIPFLGRFYGEALEKGEIRLGYDEQGLHVRFGSLRLPLRVETYPRVFEHDLARLEEEMGAGDAALLKFIGSVRFLASTAERRPSASYDEQIDHGKRILWEAVQADPRIKAHLDAVLDSYNGQEGRPETFDRLDRLLEEQAFRLSFWKMASEEINYRRFFTVNDLISLRLEEEGVFETTHQLVLRLLAEDALQGLRIDHVDGLRDPAAYLKRLRAAAGDRYIVVEKILAAGEPLPPDWPVQGTTGYDFLNLAGGLFCRTGHARDFDRLYERFTRRRQPFRELAQQKRRLIIGRHLAGNIDNLARILKRISSNDRYGRDFTLYGLRRALVELMANFPVYRTYLSKDAAEERDRRWIQEAADGALEAAPDFVYELDFITQLLLLGGHRSLADERRDDLLEFITTFQQFTAPVMAKGLEDTLFYVYNRLISLNEVGGAPDRFGTELEAWHGSTAERAEAWPMTLNATSTHDTKRGEDVRARIHVLSEMPREWGKRVGEWSRMNRRWKRRVKGDAAPDPNDEYYLYQTLIGAYPFETAGAEFTDRIEQHMVKAVREAKVHTTWIKPEAEYEEACRNFVRRVLESSSQNRFLADFCPFQRRIAHFGMINSLAQTLLKIASPGIPDFFQGTELWDFALVDPDNRRPVDFQKRDSLLRRIQQEEARDAGGLIRDLLAEPSDGRIKLFLVRRGLLARRDNRELFETGAYIPLEARGARAEKVIAFGRRSSRAWGIAIVPRFLTEALGEGEWPLGEDFWAGTRIAGPAGPPRTWRNALTGESLLPGPEISIGSALRDFPVCLLISEANGVSTELPTGPSAR
jgi:(1->4)-alpha-D-glucan 1-alpha-D-glucosylmutase